MKTMKEQYRHFRESIEYFIIIFCFKFFFFFGQDNDALLYSKIRLGKLIGFVTIERNTEMNIVESNIKKI